MPEPCSSVSLRCVVFLLVLLAIVSGCETTPRAGGRMATALDHYEASRYDLAHQHAVEALRTAGSTAEQREQAAYLAGLSAFRMGDLTEAELRLTTVMSTSNRHLLASAQAMMGQLRLEQNRPAEAAVYFEHASRGLTGEDAANAQRYVAMAQFEAGDKTAMQRWFERSGAGASHGSGTGGFTLQVGAFQDRRRAEQLASDLAETARRASYGPVNVRQSTDSRGRTLYLVQFGHFTTRQAASNARAQIGRLEYIVAPMPRS